MARRKYQTLEAIEALSLQNKKLRAWVADLQAGTYVNCVYCGHRYGPLQTTPVSLAEVLKKHIAVCPDHPMAQLLKCAQATDHALSSLLAVRDGATDQFLFHLQCKIREAIAEATRQ